MGFLDFLSKPAKPMLGLDISSSAVKLIELSQSADGYKVEAYRVMLLPANTVVEKNITDVDALAKTVEQLVNRSGTKLTDTAVAVSGSSVITKEIELPAGLTDLQLEMQIEVEADQYIPYPMEEVAFDFDVIGPVENNQDLVRVLLAACRQENVEHRRQALESAGLNPKVVDVEGFAIERAYGLVEDQLDQGSDQVVAIADIGATMFTFTVLVDGKTIYSREQLFGGKQLTEEIQRRYGLSWEEAGEAKRKGGLPEDYESEVLAPFKESLIQHISRSLQFFYSSSNYNYIDQLFLAGGVSAIEGLVADVEASLSVPTEVANLLANMQVNPSINRSALANDGPAMMLAVGLALRSFQ
jgi:type IV pilus assembly protein PilM